jgi:hypothetical protein
VLLSSKSEILLTGGEGVEEGEEEIQGVNSLIILGAWVLWKHTNACVFDGITPWSLPSLGSSKRSTLYGVWPVLGSCKVWVWLVLSEV